MRIHIHPSLSLISLEIFGGLLYGEGEQIFADLFKDAWRGVQSHAIVSPGVNKVPTAAR